MVDILLDTNALIWIFEGHKRINSIKDLICSKEATVYVSIVSLWEIMIKIRKEKLKIDIDQLSLFMKNHDYLELPLTSTYLNVFKNMPKYHGDPFDHMLLAQAITCPMRFITGDPIMAEYSSLVMVI